MDGPDGGLAKCSDCGMIHPPTVPGQCPAAKAQKREESVQGRTVNVFISTLSDYLHKSPDYEGEIRKINNLIPRK